MTTQEAPTTTPVLQARGLVKRYGHVVALDGADFELYPGEILGVIGDNGAGKSTLIKCLSGAVDPGQRRDPARRRAGAVQNPLDARAAGIETVYQTLAVSPALDIASNLFLGRERRRNGLRGASSGCWTRRDASEARTRMTELGILTIQNIGQPVETLSGGQRQGVAVARAAAFGQPRGDHGRADRRARRQGVGQGAAS